MDRDLIISTVLPIASIVIQVLVAVCVGWWQVRTMKHLADPALQSREREINKRTRSVISVTLTLLFISFGVILPTYNLYEMFASSGPINNVYVFAVALNAGVLVCSIIIGILSRTFLLIIDAFKGQSEINGDVLGLLSKHSTILERQVAADEESQSASGPKPKRRRAKKGAT